MTAVNIVNCPYCASFVSNYSGLIDIWEETKCNVCYNKFSVRIQVSKEWCLKLNETAVKEKDEMLTRIAIEQENKERK